MISQPERPVEAMDRNIHEPSQPAVDESGGIPRSTELITNQYLDSKRTSKDTTSQTELSLRYLLSTMASHPHPNTEPDLNTLRKLFNTHKSQVNAQDDNNKTAPLHIAARRGLVDAVEELLEADAELEVQDSRSSTPLLTATVYRQVEVMAKLLMPRSNDEGYVKSQLEIRGDRGWNPLLWSSIKGFSKGVKLLIDAGADCNARTRDTLSTPLITSSSWGREEVVKVLLDTRNPHTNYVHECVDLNLQDADGGTALHAAVIGEHEEIVKLLLTVKADPTLWDQDGQAPLHIATDMGSKCLIELLADVDVNVTDAYEQTALHLASERGAARIMRTWTAMQTAVANLGGTVSEAESVCDFTWVHLPATNMDWMNDLLERILKDENCCPRHYYEAKSFFQDSWLEVPDRVSESRMMRPRTVLRRAEKLETRQQDNGEGVDMQENANISRSRQRQRTFPVMGIEGDQLEECEREKRSRRERINGSERETKRCGKIDATSRDNCFEVNDPKFLAASAIYMPYLCLSVNLDEDHDNFKKAKKDYESLLAAYPTESIVHRSPTLDEWYYHFAEDQREDRNHRNASQVTTRYLEQSKFLGQNGQKKRSSETSSLSDDLALVRVNQVWIWTISNKWLITANSCLFDESGDALVQGILDQLSKQAEYGGRKSQPGSASEMGKLIIEYCIGSYERRPEFEGQAAEIITNVAASVDQQEPSSVKQLSIGQIYSNHMNKVSRDETALFEAIQNWKKTGRSNYLRDAQPESGKAASESKIFSKDLPKALNGTPVYDDIETTIQKAYTLSSDIKDVRDELNILKSVAQYQEIVQKGMKDSPVNDGELSAAYVVNNIKEMDIVADRIQSAIYMTLSLQQSEIANRNAILSVQHGKVLMIFTFATLLFFALSQHQSLRHEGIVVVSIAVSVAVGFVAFYAEDIRKSFVGVWKELKVQLRLRHEARYKARRETQREAQLEAQIMIFQNLCDREESQVHYGRLQPLWPTPIVKGNTPTTQWY
ncbi:uncharacterized protein BDZ83DRAFT_734000 [Colletotrichum acutatum]|uniref:Ankyrin repeat protein n=1 Tax=Glomerella acutata TaxID=27357 RepID=A0AAD8UAW3_GLOAC|nr:uncharacterized protein BDZ83DRAFT_734000 [Colletotrichum acutatum]KAK1716731.1 hypothetical protein BDZ83DRAFT_734000 [Colletotrichum acutatum]